VQKEIGRVHAHGTVHPRTSISWTATVLLSELLSEEISTDVSSVVTGILNLSQTDFFVTMINTLINFARCFPTLLFFYRNRTQLKSRMPSFITVAGVGVWACNFSEVAVATITNSQ
jgi:dolichol kinase